MKNRICFAASWVAVVTLFGLNCPAAHPAHRSVTGLDHWYQNAKREVRHRYDEQRDLSLQAYVAAIKQLNLEQTATIRRLRGREIGAAVRGFSHRRQVEAENYRCLQDDLRDAYHDRLRHLEARYLAERRNLLASSLPLQHARHHDGHVEAAYTGGGHAGEVQRRWGPPAEGGPAYGRLGSPLLGQQLPQGNRSHASGTWGCRGVVSGMLDAYLTQTGGFRR